MKIYQEELGCRKSIDIFAQPSSAEFMKLLQPETENLPSESQVKMEDLFVEKASRNPIDHFRTRCPSQSISHLKRSHV